MKLTSKDLTDGQRVPADHAAGVPGSDGPVPGPNRSPHLAWSELPAETKSFAVFCHDPDVPSKPDDVNQKDRTVPYDLPRVDFYHWVLVDVPKSVTELSTGQDGDGFTPRGKKPGKTDHGVRGINSYTDWFAGDADMSGDYGGYDGPWPPFNDERLHHYVFTVYALDTESLGLSGSFTGTDASQKMKGHVLAEAKLTATYSLYPNPR